VVGTNDSTGCIDTMADSATVTIDPEVTAALSIATAGGDTVCSGSLLTITATAVNGGSTPTFAWYVDGVAATVAGGAYSYMPSDGDVITAVLTSSAPCAVPDTASSSLTLTVLPTGLPTVHVTAVPGDSVCAGTMTHFATTISYGGSAPLFAWVVNGSIVSTGSSYAYEPHNDDAVYCVLASNYQCKTADSGISDTIIMTVADSSTPIVTVTASPGVTIAHGQNVILTATVTGGGPTPMYQWYVNGTAVAGAVAATYNTGSLSNGDSVSCDVTGNDICNKLGAGWAVFEVSDAGLQQQQEGATLTILPNPNKGTFVIRGSIGATSEAVNIELTDLLGQRIYDNNVFADGGRMETQIVLPASIASGTYLLRVSADNGVWVFHVVVN